AGRCIPLSPTQSVGSSLKTYRFSWIEWLMTAILYGCIKGLGCKEETGWLLSAWVFGEGEEEEHSQSGFAYQFPQFELRFASVDKGSGVKIGSWPPSDRLRPPAPPAVQIR
ncbi:MAG: hypothetical protein CL920_10500, partial [Deltaproteobacteria bacterium]|nr:hypothetical protein [Deltaproteobacteria bacterium]